MSAQEPAKGDPVNHALLYIEDGGCPVRRKVTAILLMAVMTGGSALIASTRLPRSTDSTRTIAVMHASTQGTAAAATASHRWPVITAAAGVTARDRYLTIAVVVTSVTFPRAGGCPTGLESFIT